VRRCVVTGAAGLIGSHLLATLGADWEVHAVSRSEPAGGASGIFWHRMDVSRTLDPHALPDRVDAVIYLAQSEHFRDFPDRALDIFEVNTVGLLRFLEYARRNGARSFVYGSSGGVYGSGDAGMTEEAAIPAEGNLGFYLGSKLCSEIVALNYARFMSIALLRFFFVYGPGQRRTMLIPRLIESVRSGTPVQLQGNDGIRINPTHVADAAAAIVRALDLDGTHKINVAGPEILSLREICETIGRAVGRRPVYALDPATPRHIIGDITKMRELLVPPRVAFADGIRTML
jgi:nucleoside-diphosphate-sugar epimerase